MRLGEFLFIHGVQSYQQANKQKNINMTKTVRESHPIIYTLGKSEKESFPLILTIGREPNDEGTVENYVEKMDSDQLKSLPGGVWTTAYTHIAKQYFGPNASAEQLKYLCFKYDASPLLFSNAFPESIPNDRNNKQKIRKGRINRIPDHINSLFSNRLIERVQIVIQHGSDMEEHSKRATEIIRRICQDRNFIYVSSPFFDNRNSKEIQRSLEPVRSKIKHVVDKFIQSMNIKTQ